MLACQDFSGGAHDLIYLHMFPWVTVAASSANNTQVRRLLNQQIDELHSVLPRSEPELRSRADPTIPSFYRKPSICSLDRPLQLTSLYCTVRQKHA